jgi:hypothetical protein
VFAFTAHLIELHTTVYRMGLEEGFLFKKKKLNKSSRAMRKVK